MNYLYLVLEVILGYLIGSVNSAVWIGKMFYGIDIREHGSGNAGATNVIRVLGYKAGIPVLLFDMLKGWFAVYLAVLFHPGLTAVDDIIYLKIALALAAVFGHVFPVFAGFKGGKGVGTLAGAGIALFPFPFVCVFFIFAITLAVSHYVSLSSLFAGIALPFFVYFLNGHGSGHPGLVALSLLIAVFIPFTHRKNIKRLLKGEENKFDFLRKKQSQPK
jgi:glycerol-3-phosphate acyltransferase PlsY